MSHRTFEKARTFIYRNARPLDLARFQYHFENGSREAVVNALSYYQNEDGGCGHALEADCWNPCSTPLHSNTASDLLREIDFDDASHPFVQGLLRYYGSGADFDGTYWSLLVPGNDQYPHAPWWHVGSAPSSPAGYNCTAQIAGFIIRFADRGSELFRLGVRIANEAIAAFCPDEMNDMFTCTCYVRMLEWIEQADAANLIPYNGLKADLHRTVNRLIEKDTAKWKAYVCRPSQFMTSRDSAYYADNRETADYECKFIIDTQLDDGSFEIPWKWDSYPDEWAVSRNWLKSAVAIENLLYLRGFGIL